MQLIIAVSTASDEQQAYSSAIKLNALPTIILIARMAPITLDLSLVCRRGVEHLQVSIYTGQERGTLGK